MMVIIVKREIVARDVRERMIEGAVRLLALHGLQATSFNEVLELTGAPRGSIYHHFPGGKDELISAAVDRAGAHALHALDDRDLASAEEITAVFLGLVARVAHPYTVQGGMRRARSDGRDRLARSAE